MSETPYEIIQRLRRQASEPERTVGRIGGGLMPTMQGKHVADAQEIGILRIALNEALDLAEQLAQAKDVEAGVVADDSPERVEMWFIESENRWYWRILSGDGNLIVTGQGPNEQAAIDLAMANVGALGRTEDIAIYHVESEMHDSRPKEGEQFGPSTKLWSR